MIYRGSQDNIKLESIKLIEIYDEDSNNFTKIHVSDNEGTLTVNIKASDDLQVSFNKEKPVWELL